MPYEPCPHPDKLGYPSERRALTALRAAQRMRKRYGPRPVRVYLCRCGLWHLTSKALR